MKIEITWKKLACLFYAAGGLSMVLATANCGGLTPALFTMAGVMFVGAIITAAANA